MWQKVDSFFWFCRFNSKLSFFTVTDNEFERFLFLIPTFVKTNSNLMSDQNNQLEQLKLKQSLI